MTTATVFDAASLSKVLATAPAILLLPEDGKLDLDAKLVDYFPECAGGGKEAITIRHLLTHTSGLAAGLPAKPAWHGDEAAHAMACAQTVTHPPGSFFRYSDINYILLGQLVRKLSGMELDVFARERLFGPLRMHAHRLPAAAPHAGRRASRRPTRRPSTRSSRCCTATSSAARCCKAWCMIRPCAGSAAWRARPAYSAPSATSPASRACCSADGTLDGVRVLSPESVRLLTTVQSPPGIAALRGLGMDIDSPFAQRPRGSLFPLGSYGHTGFTGCVLWIDPGSRSFYVLLSNRVYPDDKANVLSLYTELGTLSARAAGWGAGTP